MKLSRFSALCLASALAAASAAPAGASSPLLQGIADVAKDSAINAVTDKVSDVISGTVDGALSGGSSTPDYERAPKPKKITSLANTNWHGVFPAASGSGVDVTVSFAGNGLYRRVDKYLTDRPYSTFVEMGTWNVASGKLAALVSSSGDKTWFMLDKKGSLVLSDEKGAPITEDSLNYKLNYSEDANLFNDDRFVDVNSQVTFAGKTQNEKDKKENAVLTLRGDSSYRFKETLDAKKAQPVYSWGRWAQLNHKTILLTDASGAARYIIATDKGCSLGSGKSERPFNKSLVMTRTTEVDLTNVALDMAGIYQKSADGETMNVAGLTYAVKDSAAAQKIASCWTLKKMTSPAKATFKGHFETVRSQTGRLRLMLVIDAAYKLADQTL